MNKTQYGELTTHISDSLLNSSPAVFLSNDIGYLNYQMALKPVSLFIGEELSSYSNR
jgi:hypothetical protein